MAGMTMSNVPSGWNVGRASGSCAACGAVLSPGVECWAALCDRPLTVRKVDEAEPEKGRKAAEVPAASPFVRVDFCEKCWGEGKRPGDVVTAETGENAGLTMFSFWKTTVPTPQHKKKLLVDDSVLVDVFGRMEGRSEPQEVRFRFVLALILMRKRLLKYEGMEEQKKAEVSSQKSEEKMPELWRMIPRGQEAPVLVVNPHLTGEQIVEVSQQLSAILAEEV